MEKTEITERKEGVKVEVELKRGTGTRDQDTVSVRAYYDDVQEAHARQGQLHALAKKHAHAARNVQPDEGGEGDS